MREQLVRAEADAAEAQQLREQFAEAMAGKKEREAHARDDDAGHTREEAEAEVRRLQARVAELEEYEALVSDLREQLRESENKLRDAGANNVEELERLRSQVWVICCLAWFYILGVTHCTTQPLVDPRAGPTEHCSMHFRTISCLCNQVSILSSGMESLQAAEATIEELTRKLGDTEHQYLAQLANIQEEKDVMRDQINTLTEQVCTPIVICCTQLWKARRAFL